MKIKKYHFWLLFFFVIFGFTFGMIIWTVKSAVNTPVYEDKSFLSSYHIVDDDYNKMMEDNKQFKQNYDVLFDINSHKVGLEVSDVFLGQRSLKKEHKHRGFLNVGKNSITISVVDKNSSSVVKNAKIELLLTRAIKDNGDLDIKSFEFQDGKYKTIAMVPIKGHWNLTGKISVGNQVGYFFIKTNTSKK
ncbi:MAG: hypothetical protein GXO60_06230 [Epsilonproteobacteria bacterium]|nr:hypothetical protein [Campylobacterota bacterium]